MTRVGGVVVYLLVIAGFALCLVVFVGMMCYCSGDVVGSCFGGEFMRLQ